jgi:hypothetical protein
MSPEAKVRHAREMTELALIHAQESKRNAEDWHAERIRAILVDLFLTLQDDPEIVPAPWMN